LSFSPDIGRNSSQEDFSMNETVKQPIDEPTPANANTNGAEGQADAAAPRDGFAVVEALNAENAALKDRILRTLAEMENLRRRTEREVADSKTYGVTSFARDMLNVTDNLARALDHIPSEVKANADEALKGLIEGVELTARDLAAALARHGVRKLDPLGEKFDPNFHQAMFEMPDATIPAGTVTQVVQSGWRIGDRVLRPASVGVSRGGPRATASTD
jgi:molecular chaperone GrpE